MVRTVGVSKRPCRARMSPPVATAICVAAPATSQLVTRLALFSAAAWLSVRSLAIEFPKISLPSLPSLPKLGGKKQPATPSTPKAPRVPRVNVKVRAASNVNVVPDAPTLAELTGKTKETTIGSGEGWKRFPERRMPGANMDRWKKISKEITPKI